MAVRLAVMEGARRERVGTMTAGKRRQHGSGSVHQRARDGRWVATFDAGYTASGARRRPTRTARTEAEARRLLKEMQRANARDEQAATRMTVRAWATVWLAIVVKTDRPTTHTANRTAVRWIVATIGQKRLDQLTPADVRAVATAVTSAGKSTSTARRYVSTLQVMLKAALADGYPVPARVLAVKKPPIAVNDRKAIPTPDVLALLAAAGDLRPPGAGSRWLAAFLQGLRQAEALGLTWDEGVTSDALVISWQLKPLPYNVSRDRRSGFRIPDGYEARRLDGALHLVRPKSKAGWRVIPLLPVMTTALEQWREHGPSSPHGLVWPAVDGSPLTAPEDAEAWRALQAAAKVAHPSGRPYKGHEARHATATLLMELGVPESVRVAIMGHSSITTTHGYEHVDTTLARDALVKMAERLQLG